MPKFLSRQEIYRVLQRELPEGVYPDGAPSAFFSTAENDSVAQVVETSYTNLSAIYDNFFIQTANEKLSDWEFQVFGVTADASLGIDARRNRLLAKVRSTLSFSVPDMIAFVLTVIGVDKQVEIAEYGNYTGSWMLGYSQLGVETILAGGDLLRATGDGAGCSRDGHEYGIDPATWQQMRNDAYTYEVRIYNYTLSSAEYQQLDEALTKAEPARSAHVITSGLTDADKLGGLA